jgi:hypothetical protein
MHLTASLKAGDRACLERAAEAGPVKQASNLDGRPFAAARRRNAAIL